MPSLPAFDELRRRLSAVERALLQGFTAGEERRALTDNPYLPGTTENAAWDEAWKLGIVYGAGSDVPQMPL